MSREEAKQFLIKVGVAEPTDEAITDYLNQFNGAITKEKALADKYKADALKAKDLEAQLEALNNEKLSDIEKANKATETANKQIADLQAQIAKINLQKDLAQIGIVGEDADNLIGADGRLNTTLLGQIISNRETSAKSQLEKELLDGTPNPKGGKDKNDKTEEDVLVESIAKGLAGEAKSSNDIVNAYL